MKRSLTLLLASLFLVFSLTACGGNGTRDVLDDAGRALTGNNGTANRSAGSNIR